MNDQAQPTTLFAGQHLSLLAHGTWEFARRNTARPAVGIVAITNDRNLILVEQYRPPAERTVIELPAGLAGDIQGAEDEPLLAAARRELFEETGYGAQHWTELGGGLSSPGLTDESIVFFLAQGLEKQGAGGGDDSEEIMIHEVPLEHVLDWLQQRQSIASVKLFAGLFLANQTTSSRTRVVT